jgi:Na+/melibiose symporter-like transporter
VATAITLGIVGLCFVVGWAATGATRGYLGLLGLALLAAAGVSLIPEGYRAARALGLAVIALLVVIALLMAVAHTRRRVAQLRSESAAREQAFFEMFQAADAKQRSASESSSEEDKTS